MILNSGNMIAYDYVMSMYDKGVVAFRMKDIIKATGISEQAIRRDMKQLIKDGIVIEVKKGIYAFDKYNEFQIACAIAKMHTNNYYIGGWGAMMINEMTEQVPFTYTIITDNYRDRIKIKSYIFEYRIRRNRKNFIGIKEKEGIRWSDKVKTIVDMFESDDSRPPTGIKEMIRTNRINKAEVKKCFKKVGYKKYIENFNYVFGR